MSLSVIIPTLNAVRFLPAPLAALRDIGDIVVADGSSTDGKLEIAKSLGVRIIATTAAQAAS